MTTTMPFLRANVRIVERQGGIIRAAPRHAASDSVRFWTRGRFWAQNRFWARNHLFGKSTFRCEGIFVRRIAFGCEGIFGRRIAFGRKGSFGRRVAFGCKAALDAGHLQMQSCLQMKVPPSGASAPSDAKQFWAPILFHCRRHHPFASVILAAIIIVPL